MLPERWMICAFRPEIILRSLSAIGRDSTASVSTSAGAFALDGEEAMRMMLKLSIITGSER